MNKNAYKLDIILCMRVASYFENNATAVEEKVKIFQKRLLHQTWAGLVSSKTLQDSHMCGFFSNWTMQCFTEVIPCTGSTAVAQELFASPP